MDPAAIPTLRWLGFEVDAALVGERVTLRFDPARKPNKRAVEVWHQGCRVEIARRVDMLANSFKTATDSRIVMDEGGAETLSGKGDALLKTAKGVVRVQCALWKRGTSGT